MLLIDGRIYMLLNEVQSPLDTREIGKKLIMVELLSAANTSLE